MTQPDNTTPAASGQPDSHLGELATAAAILLLLAHGDDALALEHRAAEQASRPVRVAARDLSRWVTREWVLRFGALDARPDPVAWSGFAPAVVQQLRAVQPDPAPVVAAYASRALALGTRQGAATLALPVTPAVPDPVTERMAAATTQTVAARYDTAEQLLTSTSVETRDDAMTALAPTHAAAADVERDARTIVNTALNVGGQQVAEANGADLMWESLRDACVTCLALSGTVVGHDEDFPAHASFGKHPTPWWTPDGTTLLRPPRHPSCFPAGVVTSGPSVEAATSRWYSGELVYVRVASGEVLPVTPNHPVLTTQGWVAAGLLDKGAQVVRDNGLQRVFRDNPKDHQRPTRIEDVAATLRIPGGVRTERVPVAPEDFHGDGTDGHVDVVRPNLCLRHRPKVFEPIKYDTLMLAGDTRRLGTSGSHADEFGQRDHASARRSMSSVGQLSALLGAQGCHPCVHGRTTAPQVDTASSQERCDGASADLLGLGDALDALASFVASDEIVRIGGMPSQVDVAPLGRVRLRDLAAVLGGQCREMGIYSARLGAHSDTHPAKIPVGVVGVGAELVGECLAALAGLVTLDEVVEVTRGPFAGHVYNLETSDGWYAANGLIVHNCRCRCVPYLGHAGPPGSLTLPEALKREAQRSILKGWSLPSESERVRVAAAERLLARGSNLPKTVQQVARDAVKRGRFIDRTVPHG